MQHPSLAMALQLPLTIAPSATIVIRVCVSGERRRTVPVSIKAGTDYGTYSAAQPDAAAKNMMFTSVDSQQTFCEHAMNMFRGRAVLLWNEPKIVGFQDKHKGIPCCRMLVRPSCGGSLCHKHFFSNFRTSCSWLP